MDPIEFKSFPSKILLFGEYLVLHNGSALSYPYEKYTLKKSPDLFPKNRKFYEGLLNYIRSNEVLRSKISETFADDIQRGLHFDSSIPVGYGLGSSGALVAAIYDLYFHYKEADYKLLKFELAEIESFFHDKSSGIDPLTSYLKVPILFSKENVKVLSNNSLGKFTLYDSGIKRNAKEAIKHFNFKFSDIGFQKKLSELKELSEIMIQKWLISEPIQDELKLYSQIQFICFKEFIPDHVAIEWERGLIDNTFYMKLCGAGMGGMYLKYLK